MAKTILVPIDGSALSERAVPYAIALGKVLGAKLVFMRAVLTAKDPSAETQRFNHSLMQEAEENLRTVASGAQAEDVSVESVVWDDEAAHAIVDVAKKKSAHLIVMSSHGRGGLGRAIYGSIAEPVLHRAATPVLVVPAHAHDNWSAAEPFRMVVPLDGSALSEEALAPAAELADAFRAELILIRALPLIYPLTGEAFMDPYREPLLAEAREYLRGIAARLREPGRKVPIEVAEGDPARMILKAAGDYGAHAIVMTTHGRGGLARLVMGSVADSVLRHSTVPILVLRPVALHTSPARRAAIQRTERSVTV